MKFADCSRFCLLLLAILLPAQASADADTITLRFAPGDGAPFTRTFNMEVEMETPTGRQPLYRIETRRSFTFSKTTDGWLLTSEPLDIRLSGNMPAHEKTISQLLLNRPLRARFTENGKVVSIEGFESIREDAITAFGGSLPPNYDRLLDPDLQIQRQKIALENRYSDLADQTVSRGKVLQSQKAIDASPPMNVRYFQYISFPRIDQTDAGPLVHEQFFYSNAQSLNPQNPEPAREALEDVVVTEAGERRYMGNTLQLLEESSVKTYFIPMKNTEGEPLIFRRVETSRLTYDY